MLQVLAACHFYHYLSSFISCRLELSSYPENHRYEINHFTTRRDYHNPHNCGFIWKCSPFHQTHSLDPKTERPAHESADFHPSPSRTHCLPSHWSFNPVVQRLRKATMQPVCGLPSSGRNCLFCESCHPGPASVEMPGLEGPWNAVSLDQSRELDRKYRVSHVGAEGVYL